MTHSIATRTALADLICSTGDARNLPQPFAHDITLLECYIAGTTWRELDDIESRLQASDEFTLRREPDNSHDTWAIKVMTHADEHLGYIPRANNEPIARLLDAGKLIYARLIAKTWKDDWLRIDVEIIMREL
ncbi:MAG: HIRAN domain-containing protein [Pyrinomonadaceae bacterium]